MAEDRKFEFKDGKFVNRVSGEAIPDDEPVILFRARDKHALQLLDMYQMFVTDPHHKQAVIDRINEFKAYREKYPERIKEPGITGDIVLNKDKEPELFPFWISWWQDENIAFDLNTPWWYTGSDMRGRSSICAAIRAMSEEHAKQLVLDAHDTSVQLDWRFIEEHPTNWSPFGSRFRKAEWMQW